MNTSHHRVADVERYIHELAIALSGLPIEDREDVIAGIREHIDDALLAIDDPTPADVRRVLDGLGDPLAIAADAGAQPATGNTAQEPARSAGATAHAESQSTSPAAEPGPLLQRAWVPTATVASLATAALLAWLAGSALLPIAIVAWVAGLVVLVASPLWTAFEKFIGLAAFGAAPAMGVITLGLLTGADRLVPVYPRGWEQRWLLDRPVQLWMDAFRPTGMMAMAIVATLVLAVVGAWLWRRGSSRVTR